MQKIITLLILITCIGCQEAIPRRPLQKRTGCFIKASVKRNKKLLKDQETAIKAIIETDSLNSYQQSTTGSWYFYKKQIKGDTYTPQTDDIVIFTYNLVNFDNDTLYSMKDIGIVNHKIDKQELIRGLSDGLKILKENEIATFLFPSSLAYGYPGDRDRIGANVPLKATIHLLKIEKNKSLIVN